MIISNNLILLAVVFLCPSSNSASFIHQIVNGSLSGGTLFHFSIMANQLTGVVLYSTDTKCDRLGLTVSRGSNNEKQLDIKYNKDHRSDRLKSICGCDTCDNGRIEFSIQTSLGLVAVACNNLKSITLITAQLNNKTKDGDCDTIEYRIPKKMVNESDRIYIMMGNIGPYVDYRNKSVYPLKQQIIGCLIKFKYNNESVAFIEEGTKMNSSCQWKCTNNNICNGGLCRRRIGRYDMCDCSLTALNGPYCNNSLRTYIPGANNSYVKIEERSEVSMKMTWEVYSYKMHCLMEIIGGRSNHRIYINGTVLMIDDVFITEVHSNGTNFVTVNITHNYVTVKTTIKESKLELPIYGFKKINIGFSERDNKCETFEGSYDLFFDHSQLRLNEYSDTTTNTDVLTSPSTTSSIIGSRNTWDKSVILLCGVLCIISSLLFVTGCLMHWRYRRSWITPTNRVDQVQIPISIVTNVRPNETNFYNSLNYETTYEAILDNNVDGIYDYMPMTSPFQAGTIMPPLLPLPRNI